MDEYEYPDHFGQAMEAAAQEEFDRYCHEEQEAYDALVDAMFLDYCARNNVHPDDLD